MNRRTFLLLALLPGLAFAPPGGRAGGEITPSSAASPAGPVANRETPDVLALLARAAANAARDPELEQALRSRHAYTRTKVTEHWNTRGECRRREESRQDFTPARPEPAPEHDPADDPDGREDGPRRARRAYERRDFAVTPELLQRFEFTLRGREQVHGRETWVVDFCPADRQPPARGLKEKFISRTAGRVWIDAAETFVVRASLRLTEPLDVAGGLVGALSACDVWFERARTPGGLWYTRLLTWRIEGRKFLSRRIMTHRDEITGVEPPPAAQEAPAASAAGGAG